MTVTTVGPAGPGVGGEQSLVPASCRVSILVGDDRLVDMVVPAAVNVSVVIEPLREALNRQLRARGADTIAPGTHELARAVGLSRLASNSSLAAQGIVDGDLLTFVSAGEAVGYTPTIENVSTALARWAKANFRAVSGADAVAVAAALVGVSLVCAVVLLWRLRWATSTPLPSVIVGSVAAVLVAAAAVAARLERPRAVADGAAWAGVGLATVAAAMAPPGAHPGAPHAFLAAVVALVGAVAIARATQRYWSASAAIATTCATALVVGAVRMAWDVPGQRIGITLLVAVLIAAKAAPSIGRRLARVPRQSFASITGKDIFGKAPGESDTLAPVASAANDQTLSGEEVAAVALRSNRVLAGILFGVAVVEVCASLLAVNPGHSRLVPSIVIVMACAGVLILRARAFRDRRHAITTVCGAVFSMFTVPVHVALAAPAAAVGTTIVSAAAVVSIAVAGMVAGAVTPARTFTETFRAVVEYTEYVVAALVIPFAAWAIGLFEYIRLR